MLLSLFSLANALFPGSAPDEGDYRHLYSTICVTLRVYETPHLFPYSMGWFENLRYPKDRMHLQLMVESESQLSEQVKRLGIFVLKCN